MGVGAVSAAYHRQLRVPEDLSIVGFDDRLLAAQAQPCLTTVALPQFEMGHEAGKLVVVAARGESIPHGVRQVECRHVVRATTLPRASCAERYAAECHGFGRERLVVHPRVGDEVTVEVADQAAFPPTVLVALDRAEEAGLTNLDERSPTPPAAISLGFG